MRANKQPKEQQFKVGDFVKLKKSMGVHKITRYYWDDRGDYVNLSSYGNLSFTISSLEKIKPSLWGKFCILLEKEADPRIVAALGVILPTVFLTGFPWMILELYYGFRPAMWVYFTGCFAGMFIERRLWGIRND